MPDCGWALDNRVARRDSLSTLSLVLPRLAHAVHRRVLCALAGALLFVASAYCSSDDDRVSALNEQIHTLEGLSQSTADAAGKARFDDKLKQLRQELKILQDRVALETRERELQAQTTASTLDLLREKLRSVEFVADDATPRLTQLATQRRQAMHDRDQLGGQLSALKAEKNPTADRIVELEDRVATKDEELRALALEREAVDAANDLGTDANQLRDRLKAADTTANRPTLRALFESYTRARTERQNDGRLAIEANDLAQKLQISQDTLAISRQKLAKFDEELALLEKQTSFFRRDERIERLLALQRNQKATLGARLPFLTRQVDAITQTQQALHTRQELAMLRAKFEEENFARLKGAYVQRLRWPSVALGGLVIFYVLSSFIVLPLAFRNESLFLARRFARYVVILLGAGVMAGFLFEDLSMIVATLGIVSAALVISLQDVCTSIAGWAVVMIGGKFHIGDRLEIEGTRGDVLDIQLLRTTMLEINAWLGIDQPTGRVIVVPNNIIFKAKVFNFNHGHPFIWGKIDVTVTFSTPVATALTVFQRVLEEETRDEFLAARRAAQVMQRRYGVEDAVYEPRIYTQIADSGITISLFYVSHYREYSTTRNRINRRLIAEIETHPQIQLAYNTLSIVRAQAADGAPSAILGSDVTTPPFRGYTEAPRAVAKMS